MFYVLLQQFTNKLVYEMWLMLLIWSQKHAEDLYVHIYNDRYSANHFPLQQLQTHCHVACQLILRHCLWLIADCFQESMVTLDGESINCWFKTLLSALFTGLTLKMTQSMLNLLVHYSFKTSIKHRFKTLDGRNILYSSLVVGWFL